MSIGNGSELDREIDRAEKALLSSFLYYYEETSRVLEIESVSVDCFISRYAKRIFQVLKKVPREDNKYDPVIVLDNLKSVCLNDSELSQCVNYFESLTQDIQYFSSRRYFKILQDSLVKRELDKLSDEIKSKNLSSEEFDTYLENWKKEFNDITSKTTATGFLDSIEAVHQFDELVALSIKEGRRVSYLKTGYLELDKKIKALSGGQLVIIASRPGVGKTTFALNLIKNNFDSIQKSKSSERTFKQPAVGIFSLEMPTSSLLEKLFAIDGNLLLSEAQKLLDGVAVEDYVRAMLDKSKQRLVERNLLFCDEANITTGQIISTIKTWAREYDLKFVIIDYLQLINTSNDKNLATANQYQKIGFISRSLKVLSLELNICIISLAQLNRKAEERRGSEKSPILSDLRESGSIEQDADIVMFLYGEKNKDTEEDGSEDYEAQTGETIMLKVAKNRNGPVGIISFVFDKSKGRYKSAV